MKLGKVEKIIAAVAAAILCFTCGLLVGKQSEKPDITVTENISAVSQKFESEQANENAKESQSVLIDINTAGEGELMLLPGIGEMLAERIVTYRDENGEFSTVEEIMNVEGIGQGKFAEICEFICAE